MNTRIKNVLKILLTLSLITVLFACGGKEERKTAYLEKGKAYLADKNYKKAKIEFKNVLQIDPKFAEAYYYMGQLDERKKELGKAFKNYKKAIELDKNYSTAKIKLSKIYVMSGTEQYIKNARVLLNEVKKSDPENVEADLVLASIELRVGNQLKAVADLEALAAKDTSLVEAFGLLSSVYISKNQTLKAEKILTDGIKYNKEDVFLRMTLAKLYVKNKKYNQAEKYLKEIINIDSENYAYKAALGHFYAISNQLEKAKRVFRQAIKNDEEDVRRYIPLIEVLSTRVGLKEAISELDSYIKKMPSLYDLQFFMAKLYEKAGNIDGAKTVLNKIIAEKTLAPEGMKARNMLAVVLLSEGDTSAARENIEQILKEHPNNNNALLTNGRLSLMSNDAITAINDLRTVVKNEPKNMEASLLLARAHEINKEESLAENVLKKLIDSNPTNFRTHLSYANFLIRNKRQKDALDVIEKALGYIKNNYNLLDLKLRLIAVNNDESQIANVLDAMKLGSPQRYEVYLKKGQYYLAKMQYVEALKEFDIALTKTNIKYPVLEQVVKTYFVQKKSEQAIARLNKRLIKNPDEAASQFLLGQIYVVKKDLSKAKGYINKAINSAPKWLEPYKTLAAIYLQGKNIQEAINVYKRAIDNVSNKLPLYFKVATLYERDNNYEGAIKTYNMVLLENPDNKLAINNLAALLLDFGSKEDARKALELVVSFETIKQPALQDTLGWAYAKSENYTKAIEILNDVVEKQPKIAVFKYHLGYALYYSGDKVAAKKYLEAAASSDQKYIGKDEAEKLSKKI